VETAKAFADVVLQDNTCKTNMYDMPLCAFVGVDSSDRLATGLWLDLN
jgi:hypothetical protein